MSRCPKVDCEDFMHPWSKYGCDNPTNYCPCEGCSDDGFARYRKKVFEQADTGDEGRGGSKQVTFNLLGQNVLECNGAWEASAGPWRCEVILSDRDGLFRCSVWFVDIEVGTVPHATNPEKTCRGLVLAFLTEAKQVADWSRGVANRNASELLEGGSK